MPRRKRTPLERIGLTNGEGAEVQGLLHFMCWLKRESAPVPDTIDEADTLLARYVIFSRAESMAQLKQRRRADKPVARNTGV